MDHGVSRRVREQKDVKKPTRCRSDVVSFGWSRLTRACSARRGACSSVTGKRRLPGVTILVNKGGEDTAYFLPFHTNREQLRPISKCSV